MPDPTFGPRMCVNCGWKPKRDGGEECDACARYRQRNGEPRPVYLIRRELQRAEREAS